MLEGDWSVARRGLSDVQIKYWRKYRELEKMRRSLKRLLHPLLSHSLSFYKDRISNSTPSWRDDQGIYLYRKKTKRYISSMSNCFILIKRRLGNTPLQCLVALLEKCTFLLLKCWVIFFRHRINGRPEHLI